MNPSLPFRRLVPAAFFGFTGVALGAFGAHALARILAQSGMTEAWKTAVLYQLVHAHSKRGHTMIFVDKDGRQVHDFPVGCPALD